MLEQIIIDSEDADMFCSHFDSNQEYGGYLVGERTKEGIKIVHGRINQGNENNVSVNHIPMDVWKLYHSDKSRYCLVSVHAHSRSFGEEIQKYDPYWSVSSKSVKEPANTISDDFYISHEETADNDVIEAFQPYGINYVLFIHPQHGTEGSIMSKDKIQFTGYKYNATSKGKVEEIPVTIETQ